MTASSKPDGFTSNKDLIKREETLTKCQEGIERITVCLQRKSNEDFLDVSQRALSQFEPVNKDISSIEGVGAVE